MAGSLQRPDILLFDWDNTLVDAWGGVTYALNAAFAAFGQPAWTIAQTRARVRGSLRDTFPAMFGERWTQARDVFYEALAATHLDHVAPMPGAAAALAAAAAWPCGVVSNKTGRFLRAEAAHLGWTGYFGALVGAGDAAADKPARDAIDLARAQMGARISTGIGTRIGTGVGTAPALVWYVGDTAMDMRAARMAGCVAVLVGDAADDGGVATAAPDAHIRDLLELSQTLSALV